MISARRAGWGAVTAAQVVTLGVAIDGARRDFSRRVAFPLPATPPCPRPPPPRSTAIALPSRGCCPCPTGCPARRRRSRCSGSRWPARTTTARWTGSTATVASRGPGLRLRRRDAHRHGLPARTPDLREAVLGSSPDAARRPAARVGHERARRRPRRPRLRPDPHGPRLRARRRHRHAASSSTAGATRARWSSSRATCASATRACRSSAATSPPFRPLTEDEEDAVVAEIDGSGADVVWVGIGVPKQEKWMAAMRERLAGAGARRRRRRLRLPRRPRPAGARLDAGGRAGVGLPARHASRAGSGGATCATTRASSAASPGSGCATGASATSERPPRPPILQVGHGLRVRRRRHRLRAGGPAARAVLRRPRPARRSASTRTPSAWAPSATGRMPFDEPGRRRAARARLRARTRSRWTDRVADAARARHIVITLGTPSFSHIEIDISRHPRRRSTTCCRVLRPGPRARPALDDRPGHDGLRRRLPGQAPRLRRRRGPLRRPRARADRRGPLLRGDRVRCRASSAASATRSGEARRRAVRGLRRADRADDAGPGRAGQDLDEHPALRDSSRCPTC